MTRRALYGKLFENWKAEGRWASFGELMRNETGNEEEVLRRITVDPKIFGGKPIIRGRRLAVEHVLGMLAAGDSPETILAGYPWLEPEDVQACLIYARRLVGHERVEPAVGGGSS
jgi:uncharacterized protein (DUF433 family)